MRARAGELPPHLPLRSTDPVRPFEGTAAFDGTDEERLAKFREVRDQIEMRIELWLKEEG